MYHWYNSSVNSSRNLSIYSAIFVVCGFCSSGYTWSLLQSAARLLKSRYFSASSKARAANPYLSAFLFKLSSTLTRKGDSLSVFRTSGRSCWNWSANAASSRSVPGISLATALRQDVNLGSNSNPSISPNVPLKPAHSLVYRGKKSRSKIRELGVRFAGFVLVRRFSKMLNVSRGSVK